MPSRILLDTDVVVEYLRGSPDADAFLRSVASERLYLSTITVAELFSGVRDDELASLNDFLSVLEIVSVDEAIARRGGELRQRFGPSHGTGLADALIAASAERSGCRLASFNARHYPMFEDLLVPYER